VAARSKAWVCRRSLAGIAGSNSAGAWTSLSPVSVVHCQVEDPVWDWLVFQSSPTDCGVSECVHEAAITEGPGPLGTG
jgi:hypothetical protein